MAGCDFQKTKGIRGIPRIEAAHGKNIPHATGKASLEQGKNNSRVPDWLNHLELERKEREGSGIFPCLECGQMLEGVRGLSGYCLPCRRQVNSEEVEVGLP